MSVAEAKAPTADTDAADYEPGTAGCHELLDRASMMADMVERYVADHPACAARPEWHRLASAAVSALADLYQQVGALHLSAEDSAE